MLRPISRSIGIVSSEVWGLRMVNLALSRSGCRRHMKAIFSRTVDGQVYLLMVSTNSLVSQ